MMNEHLTKEFTHEEIKATLDSIGELKALGPDGTLAVFFKNFWDVVGQQLTKEVLLELDKLQNAVSVAGPDGDRGEINPQRCKNSRSRWIMTLQPTAAYSALCSLYL